MPPPVKRYKTERISRGNVNGETVNFGLLLWFRDKDSVDLAAEAIAQKYGYYSNMEDVDGAQLGRFRNISRVDFLELAVRQWIRDAIIDYRRANAETASVTAELPELPNV